LKCPEQILLRLLRLQWEFRPELFQHFGLPQPSPLFSADLYGQEVQVQVSDQNVSGWVSHIWPELSKAEFLIQGFEKMKYLLFYYGDYRENV